MNLLGENVEGNPRFQVPGGAIWELVELTDEDHHDRSVPVFVERGGEGSGLGKFKVREKGVGKAHPRVFGERALPDVGIILLEPPFSEVVGDLKFAVSTIEESFLVSEACGQESKEDRD